MAGLELEAAELRRLAHEAASGLAACQSCGDWTTFGYWQAQAESLTSNVRAHEELAAVVRGVLAELTQRRAI